MIGTPRIQARVGQVSESDDPSLVGKWAIEIILSIVGQGEPQTLQPNVFFDTEGEAKAAMRDMVRMATETVSHNMGADPKSYVDLKTNEVRKWDEN